MNTIPTSGSRATLLTLRTLNNLQDIEIVDVELCLRPNLSLHEAPEATETAPGNPVLPLCEVLAEHRKV